MFGRIKQILGFITIFVVGFVSVFYSFVSTTSAFSDGNNEIIIIAGEEYDLSDYNDVTFLYDENEITFIGDGKFTVSRDVYVYFPVHRHGIFFHLPYRYNTDWGITKNVAIKFQNVCYQEFGRDNAKSFCTNYTLKKTYNEFQIKIGDPDVLIDGVYKYHLDYVVTHAVKQFKDTDELYWNVIGTGAENATINSKTVIKHHENEKPLKYSCYTGAYGSDRTDCDMNVSKTGELTVYLTRSLTPFEGYAIVVAYPKDSLGKPGIFDFFWNFILPNLGFCMPIPIFVLMFVVWLLWGKDLKPTNVIPQYRPTDGMTPMIAAFISKMSLNNKDVSATIIDLAIRGFVKIEQVAKREYKFHNLKSAKDWEVLFTYEQKILKGLFGNDGEKLEISDKDLTDKFYLSVNSAKSEVAQTTVNNKYFIGNPISRVVMFIVLGLMFVGFCWVVFTVITGGTSYVIGGIISGIIIIIFGLFMGKRTKLGTEKYGEALGLKMYINIAEKERIKFHDKIDEKEKIKIFETLLPYAMVFGLENKWAEEFEDIYREPPEWYSTYDRVGFNSYYLMSSLSSMNSRMVSVAYGAPNTQGSHAASGRSGFSGGFSGGGFGGGSSGSW
ncbi:DUF2207 domain-containing protein [Candidatus Dojkabacteria bacterium]|nr:DUF2207 domain-containing protein [Candidatus Dojkabacteria bacterium]